MADAFGRSFLPGSSEVHPAVLEALARPTYGHPPEMASVQAELRQPLQDLFRTGRDVMLLPATATGLMEAAIRNGVDERVLVVIGGAYGERFAQVAEACGKEVVRAMVHPGRTLEAEQLAQFLDGPEVDAVALVHSETSTGALAPLSELARVILARKDVHVLVDAAGSIGGCPVETDAWGLDFVFSGSQKALALPAGIALGVASQRLIDRARKQPGRGRYFDLARMADPSGQSPVSPALPQLFALKVQLERIRQSGGIEARWSRHHEMLKLVEEWVLVRPQFSFLAPEGRRSWTVSCVRLPPGLSSDAVVAEMRSRGWAIGQGTGAERESTLRIGHMGDVTAREVGPLLADLDLVTPNRGEAA
jgi:aspartate aminotransferase-like enzyme